MSHVFFAENGKMTTKTQKYAHKISKNITKTSFFYDDKRQILWHNVIFGWTAHRRRFGRGNVYDGTLYVRL